MLRFGWLCHRSRVTHTPVASFPLATNLLLGTAPHTISMVAALDPQLLLEWHLYEMSPRVFHVLAGCVQYERWERPYDASGAGTAKKHFKLSATGLTYEATFH
eukprot:4431072-Amphidinium_carterae.2